ncbi:unnamed protein product [Protopolystoma xenopodis]|uniref:Uncharacterized protein n=1 Tax=Protopolystoma xenopodis TaxID=117903 RepID=A0A448XT63_9PLAT|nr:unnamed protein product [Protopolystoma xenopodis]
MVTLAGDLKEQELHSPAENANAANTDATIAIDGAPTPREPDRTYELQVGIYT